MTNNYLLDLLNNVKTCIEILPECGSNLNNYNVILMRPNKPIYR